MSQLLNLIEQAKRRRGINELFNGSDNEPPNRQDFPMTASQRPFEELLHELDLLLVRNADQLEAQSTIVINELEDLVSLL